MRTLRSSLVTLSLLTACSSPPDPAEAARSLSQDQRMAWWRDARFGMFLHWGLYAIPAGEWHGETDYGEWIRTSAQIPLDTYAALQPRWNPEHFDADAWAKMAADAGMKYVVITSKHHDGFCLWDSAVTDWDVAGSPNPRDILAELSAACRAHGLQFCTYHSIMDWHHSDYLPRRDWERDRATEGADFDRFERYLHAQVTEIITRYRPAVMWFDGEWESTWTHERGVRLFELCRRLAPEMIVNNRVDVHRQGMQGFSDSSEAVGDFDTPEQEIPATGLPGVDWESCMTMNRHWGWNRADTAWKSPETLIRNLIDIASKGGNYLLNVGPRADGTFPGEAVERLAAIAAWMRVNGEAIHGTTASLFDDLPWGRCTVKAGDPTSRLYLHVFERPRNGALALPGLGSTVRRAFVLGAEDRSLAVGPRPDGAGVEVLLPQGELDPIATVVVVELAGRPVVYRTPTIHSETEQMVQRATITIRGAAEADEVRYTLDGSEPTASSPRASGPLVVNHPCTVRAAMFHQGRRCSDVVQRTLRPAQLRPAVGVADGMRPGLAVTRCDVDWTDIPPQWPDAASGDVFASDTIRLPAAVGEHVALRFVGTIDVPADDVYRFALTSDDGSRLRIDLDPVIDNGGLHGAVEKRGEIALAKGRHLIEVVWFNRTGGAELGLKWARPGEAFVPVPASALRH